MKCPGVVERFAGEVCRAIPEDVEELWHIDCEEDE